MLEVDVTVEKIECKTGSQKAKAAAKGNYTLNVALSERRRRPDGLTLGFKLEIMEESDAASITFDGAARVTGTEKEIDDSISVPPGKTTPAVVEMIYEKLYGLVYILATSMKVPHPLPNLVKKNP